jgi:hypothetical protein
MTRTMRAAAGVVAAGGLWAGGCAHTGGCAGGACDDRPGLQARSGKYIDPCWPDRYSASARQNVLSYYAQHVANGTVTDGTLFEWMFEPGTDVMLPSGYAKLDYLTRRRPAPEKTVFLQTARDIVYDPAKPPEALAAARAELDTKRIAAVQKYLAATTAARGLAFEVQVMDLPDLTFSAQGPATAVRGAYGAYTGSLGGNSGGGLIGGVAAGAVGGGLGGPGGPAPGGAAPIGGGPGGQ